MQEKDLIAEDDKRLKEQRIVFKILRLLAEEHLISLQEEIQAAERIRKGTEIC